MTKNDKIVTSSDLTDVAQQVVGRKGANAPAIKREKGAFKRRVLVERIKGNHKDCE